MNLFKEIAKAKPDETEEQPIEVIDTNALADRFNDILQQRASEEPKIISDEK